MSTYKPVITDHSNKKSEKCEVCDTEFTTFRTDNRKKFCSNKCRQKRYNSKKYKEYEVDCVVCGTKFHCSRKTEICSSKCRSKNYRNAKKLSLY